MDTPGFSSIELSGMEKEDLGGSSRNSEWEPRCRFTGCAHINEPDCGVKEALLRGEISKAGMKITAAVCGTEGQKKILNARKH